MVFSHNKWLLITGILLFSIGIVCFVYLYTLVSRYDEVQPDGETRQAAIVLGAALWDQQPSPALKERLNQALTLYQEGRVQYIILSGGLGNNGITEAEGMKKYLVDRGVPENHLVLEDRSSNTKENLKFTAEVLKKHKWTRLYLVTHDYHMYRALNYARKAGISASAAPVHSKVLFIPYHKTRECLALIKLKIFKR